MISTPYISIPRATRPHTVHDFSDVGQAEHFFNRELSWLDFNARVLALAYDESVPLLERVRYLTIYASNLDEFFRKRVGGLKRQVAAGVLIDSPDGRSAKAQLRLIREAVITQVAYARKAWSEVLHPALRSAMGIYVADYAELTGPQKQAINAWYQQRIFPILTPLAVDPGHPFPFISNLSLSLAVTLIHARRGTEHFARLKVPENRGRWIQVPGHPSVRVPIEQIIAANCRELFRGMEITGIYPFRITRNADVRRDEEEADDLLQLISEELRERRFAAVVRLEIDDTMPARVKDLLVRELELTEDEVYAAPGIIDFTDLNEIADHDVKKHRFAPWDPVIPTRLRHEGESKDQSNIFDVIRQRDLLVHHPYESFTHSVQRFLEEAASDPKVLAIKQTLYRTSENSPIVMELKRAAEKGKQVAALVEVKARFDEANNIEWAQQLERSGVHVNYGLVGLKTHCKTTLVIREEEDGIRTYCHIGTGNYNPKTARLYTDVGVFTADPEVGHDMINLFHYLTGYAPEQNYKRLIFAPTHMRSYFLARIEEEMAHQASGRGGRIIAKCNSLDDLDIISALYKASQAGVQIDLIVRGHCRLRPGVKGLSENIRVRSILGRFLEHSRIYLFGSGGASRVHISSADWQRRNLEDRVEVAIEVHDDIIKDRLTRTLTLALEDNRSAWELSEDGDYVQCAPEDEVVPFVFQHELIDRARDRVRKDDHAWRT